MSPKPTIVDRYIFVYPERFANLRRALKSLLVIACLIGFTLFAFPDKSWARTTAVHPIKAPTALLKARTACPNTATPVQCRSALRRAYAGLEWAKKERIARYDSTVDLAIAVACATYPAVDCAWFKRMITCESKRDPKAKNRHSTASGLGQELDGTFAGTPYAALDVFDPFVGALSSAWLAARQGHGPWNASKGCWT